MIISGFTIQISAGAMLLAAMPLLALGGSWLHYSVQTALPTCDSPRFFRQALVAYEKHDYQEAERLWRNDLAVAKSRSANVSNDVEVWCTEMWLGGSLMEHGCYAEAESLLTEALVISRNIRTPGYYVVPNSLCRLARLYRLESRNNEADLLFAQARRLVLDDLDKKEKGERNEGP